MSWALCWALCWALVGHWLGTGWALWIPWERNTIMREGHCDTVGRRNPRPTPAVHFRSACCTPDWQHGRAKEPRSVQNALDRSDATLQLELPDHVLAGAEALGSPSLDESDDAPLPLRRQERSAPAIRVLHLRAAALVCRHALHGILLWASCLA